LTRHVERRSATNAGGPPMAKILYMGTTGSDDPTRAGPTLQLCSRRRRGWPRARDLPGGRGRVRDERRRRGCGDARRHASLGGDAEEDHRAPRPHLCLRSVVPVRNLFGASVTVAPRWVQLDRDTAVRARSQALITLKTLSARALEGARGRRDPRVGRVVQQGPPARTARLGSGTGCMGSVWESGWCG
jgi:hypothetical protein